MVMASTRVWLLAAVLACVLLVRSAGADAEAPAPANIAGFFGCNPLMDKTCRPPGDPRAPENQEEEGGLGLRMPSMPGSGGGAIGGGDLDGDGDDDDELPSYDTHMTILGH